VGLRRGTGTIRRGIAAATSGAGSRFRSAAAVLFERDGFFTAAALPDDFFAAAVLRDGFFTAVLRDGFFTQAILIISQSFDFLIALFA
jgi:hypothetical protein